MNEEVLLPKWGMGMQEGTIVQWYKAVGDHVDEDEPLAEIEAEKGTEDLESPMSGVVTALLVEALATVPVGTPIAVIDTSDS